MYEKKLTMVTITHRGKTYVTFVMCEIVNGKAYCPVSVIDGLLKKAHVDGGECFGIGGSGFSHN